MTVEQILEKLNAGSEPAKGDGVLAGDAKREVKRVAICWRATVDSVRKAAEQKCDLMITREPLYWEDQTRRAEGAMGPSSGNHVETSIAFKAKQPFIASKPITIARAGSLWEGSDSRSLDGLLMQLGLKDHKPLSAPVALGTPKAASATIPATTLESFVSSAKQKLNAKSIRVVGDKQAKLSSLVVLPGYLTVPDASALLPSSGVDAIITGDACEWESFEYAEDWITAKEGKALIMLGAANSMDPGGKVFADWVRKSLSGITVDYIPAGDPFTAVHTEVPKW